MTNPEHNFGLVPRLINGAIAGLVGVTCVFPMDLTKTRLQNQQRKPNGELMYKGIADCFKKTYIKEGGILGMYRGSAVNLLLITPEKIIKLVGNDFFRHVLKNDKGQLTLPREILSGGGAGLCQIIITTPMELLKIQLQDSGRSSSASAAVKAEAAAKHERPSATKIATMLIREKGILGVYKGFQATALRDVTFSAIYFPLFAHLKKHGKKRHDSEEVVWYHNLAAGIVAGGVASLSVNPFDVVKTRLQTLKKGEGEMVYEGISHCFKSVMQNEGPKAFFKGGLCRILVIAPLFGIAQAVYLFGVGEYITEKITSKMT